MFKNYLKGGYYGDSVPVPSYSPSDEKYNKTILALKFDPQKKKKIYCSLLLNFNINCHSPVLRFMLKWLERHCTAGSGGGGGEPLSLAFFMFIFFI